jgi:hypothetical protein
VRGVLLHTGDLAAVGPNAFLNLTTMLEPGNGLPGSAFFVRHSPKPPNEDFLAVFTFSGVTCSHSSSASAAVTTFPMKVKEEVVTNSQPRDPSDFYSPRFGACSSSRRRQ